MIDFMKIIDQAMVLISNIGGAAIIFFISFSRKAKKERLAFGAMTLFALLWISFTYLTNYSSDPGAALLFARIVFGSVSLFFLSAYFFANNFYPKKEKIKIIDILVTIIGLGFFLLAIFSNLIIEGIKFTAWGTDLIIGLLGTPFYIMVFSFTFIIIAGIVFRYSNLSLREKRQAQYLVLGLSIFALMNLIFNVFLPLYRQANEFYQFGNYSVILLVAFTAYAIIKRDLFDIKIAITSIFILLITALLVVELIFFTNLSWLRLIKGLILLLFLIFGWLLIRSTIREIEQREKLEKATLELEKANRELKRLDHAKSEFISIASHQLRTPLTAMRGYLSMLVQGDFGELSGQTKEIVAEVHQASLRLLKLSNDLLNVSRIESGKSVLNYKKTSIKDLVSLIAKEFEAEAAKKDLYLKVVVADDLPSIEIDAEKIRQAVLNITDNALKYTQKGGVKILAKYSPPENILIEIRDTGVGLNKKEIGKLFQSFSRGQAGANLYSAGTGLGLYVARKFVDQHKGRLWVESLGPDKGSSFYIELPIKPK
jgi:signal transduction histidine kinase